MGVHFGRARPATGFSFDLRKFLGRLPQNERRPAISVALADAAEAAEAVAQLRAAGETVVIDYGLPSNSSSGSTRRLQKQNGAWTVTE